MKISIVGCGGISRTHIGAVREIPDARIISVADCIPCLLYTSDAADE